MIVSDVFTIGLFDRGDKNTMSTTSTKNTTSITITKRAANTKSTSVGCGLHFREWGWVTAPTRPAPLRRTRSVFASRLVRYLTSARLGMDGDGRTREGGPAPAVT